MTTRAERFFSRTPRRGRAMFSVIHAFAGTPSLAVGGVVPPANNPPNVIAWLIVVHEAAHGLALRMKQPLNAETINTRLVALSPETRADHEIRASLVAFRVLHQLTGIWTPPQERRKFCAAAYGVAMMLEKRYGGDVRRALAYSHAEKMLGIAPPPLEELAPLLRDGLRATDRILRTRDTDADALRLVALVTAR